MTKEDKIPFVGLHAHSVAGSIFDALGYPQEHMDYAYENGMDALALTDHGNMNGMSYQVLHAKKMKAEGKEFKANMKYTLFGTTMNYFIENSILDIPDYIKIDVDGIEHLIIEGGDKFLINKKVKSLSIELNQDFKEQHEKVISMMEKYNFKFLHKKNSGDTILNGRKYKKIYNYIFVKKIN